MRPAHLIVLATANLAFCACGPKSPSPPPLPTGADSGIDDGGIPEGKDTGPVERDAGVDAGNIDDDVGTTDDAGDAGSSTEGVGAEGGTVSGDEGAQVVVPPGALSGPVDIRVAPAAPGDAPAEVRGVEAAGAVLAFTPHGQTFAVPVTIRVPYDTSLVPQGAPVVLLTAEPGGSWTEVPGATVVEGGFLEAQVDHFSFFAPRSPTAFKSIDKSCGVSFMGGIYCWGNNASTDWQTWNLPQPVSGDVQFSSVANGGNTICGLGPQWKVYCKGTWTGAGDTQKNSSTFIPIASALSFTKVVAGAWHLCALAASTGKIYCWGDNTLGQLGTGSAGSVYSTNTPAQLTGTFADMSFVDLSAGGNTTCAVNGASELYCWGNNADYEAGVASSGYVATPAKVAGNFQRVIVGNTHTCAITGTGDAYCFGANLYGEVGDGTGCAGSRPCVNDKKMPTKVPGYTFVVDGDAPMTLAAQHSCGRTGSGKTVCWGSTGQGDLGDGVTPSSPFQQLTPVEVVGPSFQMLSSWDNDTCGISTAGSTWCWGSNEYGGLGIGTTDRNSHPTPEKMRLTDLP